MKEGIGNIPIITIIVVFIAFVSGYLAYNVNYTKAFKMKNKIISIYEEYDGKCTNKCKRKILNYAKEIGYSKVNLTEAECRKYQPVNTVKLRAENTYGGYCEYKVKPFNIGNTSKGIKECPDQYYYSILTKIDIRIPIVEKFLNLRIMTVLGDTSLFPKKCS